MVEWVVTMHWFSRTQKQTTRWGEGLQEGLLRLHRVMQMRVVRGTGWRLCLRRGGGGGEVAHSGASG